jgi:hypothetical protein
MSGNFQTEGEFDYDFEHPLNHPFAPLIEYERSN